MMMMKALPPQHTNLTWLVSLDHLIVYGIVLVFSLIGVAIGCQYSMRYQHVRWNRLIMLCFIFYWFFMVWNFELLHVLVRITPNLNIRK
jgi:hypothetical protein